MKNITKRVGDRASSDGASAQLTRAKAQSQGFAAAQLLLSEEQQHRIEKVVTELSVAISSNSDPDIEQLALGAEALDIFITVLQLFGFIEPAFALGLQKHLSQIATSQ